MSPGYAERREVFFVLFFAWRVATRLGVEPLVVSTSLIKQGLYLLWVGILHRLGIRSDGARLVEAVPPVREGGVRNDAHTQHHDGTKDQREEVGATTLALAARRIVSRRSRLLVTLGLCLAKGADAHGHLSSLSLVHELAPVLEQHHSTDKHQGGTNECAHDRLAASRRGQLKATRVGNQ